MSLLVDAQSIVKQNEARSPLPPPHPVPSRALTLPNPHPPNPCCRLLAGTLLVMFGGAGWRSLFLLEFVAPGLSTDTAVFFLQCVQGTGSQRIVRRGVLYVKKKKL